MTVVWIAIGCIGVYLMTGGSERARSEENAMWCFGGGFVLTFIGFFCAYCDVIVANGG